MEIAVKCFLLKNNIKIATAFNSFLQYNNKRSCQSRKFIQRFLELLNKLGIFGKFRFCKSVAKNLEIIEIKRCNFGKPIFWVINLKSKIFSFYAKIGEFI